MERLIHHDRVKSYFIYCTHSNNVNNGYIEMCIFVQLQMFLIRWIYAVYDYLSEIIDDVLHNNW